MVRHSRANRDGERHSRGSRDGGRHSRGRQQLCKPADPGSMPIACVNGRRDPFHKAALTFLYRMVHIRPHIRA